MNRYLQSAEPLTHRAEVTRALAETESRIQQGQVETIASR